MHVSVCMNYAKLSTVQTNISWDMYVYACKALKKITRGTLCPEGIDSWKKNMYVCNGVTK